MSWKLDRETLFQIYLDALRAVDPDRLVVQGLRGRVLRDSWLLAMGKAALPMARGAARAAEGSLRRGLVIGPEVQAGCSGLPEGFQVMSAPHPVPDQRSLKAARDALSMVSQARDAGAPLLVLLSGGASSMAALPASGITLDEKAAAVSLLLRGGASIQELNCVRRHLSAIKGGHLAEASDPLPVLVLVLSDVLGNTLEDIASGPFAPDPTTYQDAYTAMRRHAGTWSGGSKGTQARRAETAGPCLAHLEAGISGIRPETPKPGDPCFAQITHQVLADAAMLRDAAASSAGRHGLNVAVQREPVQGEAARAGCSLAEHLYALAREAGDRPLCHISSGETTVTVRGSGRGGRNQELALAFALRWEELAPDGSPEALLLSAGSDGIDGPTDAAGALVHPGTLDLARESGLDTRACLRDNDSYRLFSAADGLIRTGPTGVNLLDLQIAIIR